MAEDKNKKVQIVWRFASSHALATLSFRPATNKSGKKAYITNMYMKEAYRGQGLGTNMLDMAVGEAKAAGITKIWLGASELERPVYKQYGFKETVEWLELNF
ncbi:GNAT family N-acetyltransferase [Virgibacillus oceani]